MSEGSQAPQMPSPPSPHHVRCVHSHMPQVESTRCQLSPCSPNKTTAFKLTKHGKPTAVARPYHGHGLAIATCTVLAIMRVGSGVTTETSEAPRLGLTAVLKRGVALRTRRPDGGDVTSPAR